MTRVKIGAALIFLMVFNIALLPGKGLAASSCSSSFSKQLDTISSGGGTGSVDITSSTSTCSWDISSDSSWLSIISTGKGNGTLQYSVSANTDIYPRTARLTFPGYSGQYFYSVTQSGTEMYSMAAKWGAAGAGDGQFNSPQGIAIGSHGFVYIVDSGNNRIQKFDSSGNFIAKWGTAGAGDGQFNSPKGIAIGSHGFVYIVDSGNNRIQKFDAGGNFIAKWGTAGAGDGQFNAPFGIAAAPSGYIYVSDTGNSRIQKFDSNGDFIIWWVPQYNAAGLATDAAGNVYASNCQGYHVYDSDGNKIWPTFDIGCYNRNWNPAIAVDSADQVYYSMHSNLYGIGNAQIWKSNPKDTALRFAWGSSGSGDGQFSHVLGLAVDSSGFVYAADSENNRIQKFAPIIGEQNEYQVGASANSTANKWLDTGFDITAGEQLTVTALGSACIKEYACSGPNGVSGDYNGCPFGALVGRIGDGNQFCVGSNYQQVARSSGRLSLAYNDENYYDNSGTFYVTLNVNTKTTDASPVYRFLNAGLGVFFYTIYESERDFILQNLPTYQLNGTAYFAFTTQRPGTFPVYRFYNTDLGVFFYTIYESEKDFILKNLPQYQLNGIAYYAYMDQQPGTSPIYRFLNTALGVFFYTIYESERDFILQNLPQYQLNGIAFYAYK